MFDDADDEASISEWIPKGGVSRVIVTSRFDAWSVGFNVVHLRELDRLSTLAFLARRARKVSFAELPADEQAACDELALELGCLPLALEQFGGSGSVEPGARAATPITVRLEKVGVAFRRCHRVRSPDLESDRARGMVARTS